MTELLVLTALLAVVATLVALTKRVVDRDGYGSRARPPASHCPDAFSATGSEHTPLGL